MIDIKKALIVEDYQKLLELLSLVMKEAGFDVDTARDGEQAISMLESSPYSVLLLDLLLPKVDGFEVLKKVTVLSHLPVIAFSSNVDLKQKALESGADVFIPKPFEPDEIIMAARKLLGEKNKQT